MGPLDEDSGFLHAAHAAWNALARLELILRAQGQKTEQQEKKTPLYTSKSFRALVERVRKIDPAAANYMGSEGREPIPNENRTVDDLDEWCDWDDTLQGSKYWSDIYSILVNNAEDERANNAKR
jgi:hypothetical protein